MGKYMPSGPDAPRLDRAVLQVDVDVPRAVVQSEDAVGKSVSDVGIEFSSVLSVTMRWFRVTMRMSPGPPALLVALNPVSFHPLRRHAAAGEPDVDVAGAVVKRVQIPSAPEPLGDDGEVPEVDENVAGAAVTRVGQRCPRRSSPSVTMALSPRALTVTSLAHRRVVARGIRMDAFGVFARSW